MGKIDGGYSSLQPTKKFAAMILVVPLIIKTFLTRQNRQNKDGIFHFLNLRGVLFLHDFLDKLCKK